MPRQADWSDSAWSVLRWRLCWFEKCTEEWNLDRTAAVESIALVVAERQLRCWSRVRCALFAVREVSVPLVRVAIPRYRVSRLAGCNPGIFTEWPLLGLNASFLHAC